MTPIYERTILGTYLLMFMLVMAALLATTMMFSDPEPGEGKPWYVLLFLLIAPVLMGVMRVSVDQENLRIRFLFGLPRRTVTIADIDSYRVTRSWKETGFGVSVKVGHGRYCISGPSAVSILLRNGRTLLIGTPEPEALAKAIRKARSRAGVEEN